MLKVFHPVIPANNQNLTNAIIPINGTGESAICFLRVFTVVGDNGMGISDEYSLDSIIAAGLVNVEIQEFNNVYSAVRYAIGQYCARFIARNYHLNIAPSYPGSLNLNQVFIDPDFEKREGRGR